MSKAYFAQLERFGYTITAVGRTKSEAIKAVMASYKNAYKSANGTDPAKDKFPGSDKSHLKLAESEMFVTDIQYGEAMWL